ncbi:peptide chain release factor 2 [Micavibrio aeruginosavorus]|uniref:peptide chain release factor 2 n=1 Tax=Micavibrio aeruginosavorus TaxID=349221 RepID=UPI003F4AED7F
MRADIQALVNDINESLALLRRHFDWDTAIDRLAELTSLSEDPDLWSNADKAQTIMKERNRLDQKVQSVRAVENSMNDCLGLIEMGEEEGDQSIVTEAEASLKKLRDDAQRMQITSLLSGEADANDAFLEVHAGSGGTEAQDWGEILLRMYTRWAEQHGYRVTLLQRSDGEEAGIKAATIKVEGENAYGWLKAETGVHRLVRISPFDSNARRHTSFSSVAVSPVVDDTIDIEVLDKDLKVDTFRSSGAGGQHVNTTDSAIRITHIPSGIIVACQAERSQHKNRDTAMSMLRARLYEVELKKREDATQASYGEKTEIGWGHQIRSYVLQPYQMVKDLRTEVENTDAFGVLDGDLDRFLEASLAHGLEEKSGNKQTA